MAEKDEAVQWVRRMAEGDPAAMSELYAAYGRRLYAYALRLSGNPSVAEDVTQEALVAAWKGARRYRGDGLVRTWLLGIVRNLAMKTMRRPVQPLTDELNAVLACAAPSPEQTLENNEMAAGVRKALNAMSPKHREALELVFFHGLSLEEAAQVCGTPVGTIKSRLSHAKAHLRSILEHTRSGM